MFITAPYKSPPFGSGDRRLRTHHGVSWSHVDTSEALGKGINVNPIPFASEKKKKNIPNVGVWPSPVSPVHLAILNNDSSSTPERDSESHGIQRDKNLCTYFYLPFNHKIQPNVGTYIHIQIMDPMFFFVCVC